MAGKASVDRQRRIVPFPITEGERNDAARSETTVSIILLRSLSIIVTTLRFDAHCTVSLISFGTAAACSSARRIASSRSTGQLGCVLVVDSCEPRRLESRRWLEAI